MLRASLLADVCVLTGSAAAFEMWCLENIKKVISHLKRFISHMGGEPWIGSVVCSSQFDFLNTFLLSLKWSSCKELKDLHSAKVIISDQHHYNWGGSAACCTFFMVARFSWLLSSYSKFTNLDVWLCSTQFLAIELSLKNAGAVQGPECHKRACFFISLPNGFSLEPSREKQGRIYQQC